MANDGDAPNLHPGKLSTLVAQLAHAPTPTPTELYECSYQPGDVVADRYILLRELGRGGFGVVFEARDEKLGRRVAFKAIRRGPAEHDPLRQELLLKEADAIAQLAHPNLVTLFDAGTEERGPYLILELLRGETLDERHAREPLPLSEAVAVCITVARALAHTHARGVLHRDLKPSNVFLTEDGDTKVLDFGLAHVFGASRPVRAGTPGFMAPEQVEGVTQDARTDVYALGMVLQELVGGRSVPPAVAETIARATANPKADRPASARELIDLLRKAERALAPRRRGRWTVAVAVGLGLALAPPIGYGIHRVLVPDDSGRRLVAVADVVNETGEATLDGLSGLIANALEQSRRLSVLPRAHLLDLLVAHRGAGGRSDAVFCAAARDARVDTVLLASIQRVGAAYQATLRALEDDCSTAFTFTDNAPGSAGIPAALDRLARRARRELRGGGDEAGPVIPLTQDLEAHRQYVLGEQCAARPIYGQECTAPFRAAVARAPDFAAAHYRIAEWDMFNGDVDEGRRALQEAVEHAPKAPEKVRIWIEALAAYADGRLDDAVEGYKRAADRWREDPHAPYQIADLLRHEDDFAAALPWFERSIVADPEHAWALAHAVEALGATGRLETLRSRVQTWKDAVRPGTLHALSQARGWLGDVPGAIEAAKRCAQQGGGLVALQDLVTAGIFAGQYAAMEQQVSPMLSPGSEVLPVAYYGMAMLATYQGRPGAGMRYLEALLEARPGYGRNSNYLGLRLDLVLGLGDVARARRELENLRAVDPRVAAEFAPAFAWLGDLETAEALAHGPRAGKIRSDLTAELVASRRGDRDALARLGEKVRRSPASVWRVPPIFLYAELAREAGRFEEAADGYRRFQALYLPRTVARSWAYPRSLVGLAEAEAAAGRRDAARRTLDRLQAAFKAAEPDNPLLERVRALRARLGRGVAATGTGTLETP